MRLRHLAYKRGILASHRLKIPVIIVGNIVVGGGGKTPLVIWLTEYLRGAGYRPGIISRGYKGKNSQWPQRVHKDSDPAIVGDEPVLLAQRTDCPVTVAPDRYIAAVEMLKYEQIDIIVCDDGLQHHALARDIEIAVIDGRRRYGNGRCLPAGPLRESITRLSEVDMIVSNGNVVHDEFEITYIPQQLRSVLDKHRYCDLRQFYNKTIHAVAGIADPTDFFSSLHTQGVRIITHRFPDHHQFKSADISFNDGAAVIMTEKDAVKCAKFASDRHWFMPINVTVSNAFERRMNELLQTL